SSWHRGVPRRRSAQAHEHAERAKDARWRYLIRNRDFISALVGLSEIYEKDREVWAQRLDAFLCRWGILYIGPELWLTLADIRRSKRSVVLRLLEAFSDCVLSPAVVPQLDGDDTRLVLSIDLRHPLDVLEALVTNELRDAHGRSDGRRRRIDKAE